MRKPGDLPYILKAKKLKGLATRDKLYGSHPNLGQRDPKVRIVPPPLTFRTKVRARRDMPENRDKNYRYTYTYKAPLPGLRGVPRGVTESRMPQG